MIRDAQRKGKFIFEASNQSRPVRYRYKTTSLVFPEDTRFERNQMQIIDLASGQIAATYTMLYYEWTNRSVSSSTRRLRRVAEVVWKNIRDLFLLCFRRK